MIFHRHGRAPSSRGINVKLGAIAFVVALLGWGFTSQLGTQYSQPGNVDLGAGTSVPSSATVNASQAAVSVTAAMSLAKSFVINASAASVAMMATFKLSKSLTINASAASVAKTVVAQLSKSATITASVASVAKSMLFIVPKSLTVNASAAAVALSVTYRLAKTLVINGSSAIAQSVVATLTKSATINTSAAHVAVSVIGVIAKSLTIAASAAHVAVTGALKYPISAAIDIIHAPLVNAVVNNGRVRTFIVTISTVPLSTFTSQLGTAFSRLGNFVLGSALPPQTLMFGARPSSLAGYTSQLGTSLAQFGHFVLGTGNAVGTFTAGFIVKLNLSSTVGSAAAVAVSAATSHILNILLTIRVLPGTVANLGFAIGASAARIVINYSQQVPLVIIATIRVAAAAVATSLDKKAALSATMAVSQAAVALSSAIQFGLAKSIAATAESLAKSVSIKPQIGALINVLIVPVQGGIGNFRTIVIAIGTTAANIAASVKGTLGQAASIGGSAALAATTIVAQFAVSKTIAVVYGAVGGAVRGVTSISRTINAGTAVQIAANIFRHIAALTVQIAAAASVGIFAPAQLAASATIATVQSGMTVLFGLLFRFGFGISAFLNTVTVNTILIAVLQLAISTAASVGATFGRVVQYALAIASSAAGLTASAAEALSKSAGITLSAAHVAISAAFPRALQLVIGAAAQIASAATGVLSISRSILVTRASVGWLFNRLMQLVVAISSPGESVAVAMRGILAANRSINASRAGLSFFIGSTIRLAIAASAYVANATSFTVPMVKAITATAHLVTAGRFIAGIAAGISISAASMLALLGRGIVAQAQVSALGAQLVMVDTLRAVIGARISGAEVLQGFQQIRFAISQVINAAAALVRFIESAFQPTPPYNPQVIVVSPVAPNQVVVAIGIS